MSCIQTINKETDCLYLEFLNNCEVDKIYQPLRLYENDNFVIVDGKDNKQISISKNKFEVYLDGVLYTDKDAALVVLTDFVKCVNSFGSGGGGVTIVKSNLEKLKTEANDLVQVISYLDSADIVNRRPDTIVYSSVSLALSVTETFSYGGSSGDYYVTNITLS